MTTRNYIINSYIDEWLDEDQYEEFIYDSNGNRLLYCNHVEYYNSFRTRPENRLMRTISQNRWEYYNHDKRYEPVIPISMVDHAMKKLAISEYIRLNILYRARTKHFCCLRWGVHVFPPFDISTTPILVTKFKVEILSLNEYCRRRCEVCWNNDAQNTNKKQHDSNVEFINGIFNDNYQDTKEAQRIQRELNLTENISSKSDAPSYKNKFFYILCE